MVNVHTLKPVEGIAACQCINVTDKHSETRKVELTVSPINLTAPYQISSSARSCTYINEISWIGEKSLRACNTVARLVLALIEEGLVHGFPLHQDGGVLGNQRLWVLEDFLILRV